MTKVSSVARKIGQATDAKSEVARAEQALAEIIAAKEQLENECAAEVERISQQFSPENLILEPIEIAPRKTDTRVKQVALVWIPWQIDSDGIASPLIELPDSYSRLGR